MKILFMTVGFIDLIFRDSQYLKGCSRRLRRFYDYPDVSDENDT